MPVSSDKAIENVKKRINQWVHEDKLRPTRDGKIGTLVRDALGRCALLLASDDVVTDKSLIDGMRGELLQDLGPHAFPAAVVLMPPSEHPAAEVILNDSSARKLQDGLLLVDRLQTNQDWLRIPLRSVPQVPLGVGFSIKGGVGRSTALAVLALALARDGKRVWVIDLDLEAPGIGSLLLGESPDFPSLGLIDWLTEALLGNENAIPVDDIAARAPVAISAPIAGDIRVIPAWGKETRDYVAKLGRVYMPHLATNGQYRRFADSLDSLIGTILERDEPPDVILLDSRAGLHDIGAAAVTQLGADVFLFGRDEQQSWTAYRQLFDHLKSSPQIGVRDEDKDLRLRLKMCASTVKDTGSSLGRWIDRAYETWGGLYDVGEDDPYAFSRDAIDAPHYPFKISSYDPVQTWDFTLHEKFDERWSEIEPAFKDFIEGVKERLFAQDEVEP